jgi:N-acetylglucosaminyl-diphospho-decaprenol L-rhamnosyltransferase
MMTNLHLPALDIVIVNWNAGPALLECLRSVAQSAHEGWLLNRVVVVDNASTDGSADRLDGLGLPLTVIRSSRNCGFAAACNLGAQGATAEYLLFLNPDTRLTSDALGKSIQCISASEQNKIGILGIQLVDENGNVSRTCARFPSVSMFLTRMLGLGRVLRRYFPEHFYTEWDHKSSRPIEQVMGAYFLVRSSLFKKLGGFDERFFVYFEEVDFSLRARYAGWDTYFLASAQCYHRGGGSSDQIKARRLYYSLQSRLFYAFKHFGRGKTAVLVLATLLIEPISRIAQGIIRASPKGVFEVLHGYALLYLALPRMLARTRRLRASNPG